MTASRSLRTLLLALTFLAAYGSDAQTSPSRSLITIHVGKTGLFSGFGHEHTVLAPIASGSVNTRALSVEINVFARQLKVSDPGESDKDRAEVQATMLGPQVLDVEKFPEIRFESSRVQPAGPQTYRIMGTLVLHGVSRELSFEVTGTPEHYHGKTRFKQTDFGIKPVSAGAGTVKVKDELEIEFDVYPAELARPSNR